MAKKKKKVTATAKSATAGPVASCDSIVFWSPVPGGSVFKIKGTGDQNVFNVTVGCSRNGGHETPFGHKQVVPGPASRVVVKGERWVFTVIVALFSKPPNPVVIEAWIEDTAGGTVTLPDADGTPSNLRCQWKIASVGSNMIKIFVGA